MIASRVAVSTGHDGYAGEPPFSPQHAYPEYPFDPANGASRPNPAYKAVREVLRRLDLDRVHTDTDQWNPFGTFIRPGDTVVLKPNFIREFRESHHDHGDCLITHGSIIRAALDYAYIALKGRGRLIIADAPQNDANFDAIRRIAGLDEIRALYRKQVGFDVEVYDLRPERAEKVDGIIVGHSPLPGDPAGYVKVNLGLQSAFAQINHLCGLLYGSEYDTAELHSHQHDDVHEYLISKTVLDADVIICLPKLKTHKKTGLTASMKNMVGVNGNKNWLPHHREGTPAQGGDQFADNGFTRRLERTIASQFKRVFPRLGPLRRVLAGPAKTAGKRIFGDTNAGAIRSGNWYGNDTTWRMVIDLNRIVLYADATGELCDPPVRRLFNLVDAIVAGEGNGPLDPVPKRIGVVLAGASAVAVDLVCARLMGFDRRRLAVIDRAFGDHPLPLVTFAPCDVEESKVLRPFGQAESSDPVFSFEPHFGWRGHVELV